MLECIAVLVPESSYCLAVRGRPWWVLRLHVQSRSHALCYALPRMFPSISHPQLLRVHGVGMQGLRDAVAATVHAMVQHNGQADRSLYGGIEGEGKSWSRRGMDLR